MSSETFMEVAGCGLQDRPRYLFDVGGHAWLSR
jgi:hypothetical protein